MVEEDMTFKVRVVVSNTVISGKYKVSYCHIFYKGSHDT